MTMTIAPTTSMPLPTTTPQIADAGLVAALSGLVASLTQLVTALTGLVASMQAGTGAALLTAGGPATTPTAPLTDAAVGAVTATASAPPATLTAPLRTTAAAPTPAPAPAAAPTPALPPNATAGERIVAYARTAIGKPYVFATRGPGSYDCSGLSLAALREVGVKLPHSSSAQFRMGTPVEQADLAPGDLVFFQSGDKPGLAGHVGVYAGNRQFIHASSPSRGIRVSSLDEPYYVKRYHGARRYL